MEEKKLIDSLSKDYIIEVVYHNNAKYGEYFSFKFAIGDDIFYLKVNDNDKKLFYYLLKQDIVKE